MSLRFVLLALLSQEPNTGYGLSRLLRGQLHHLWEVHLQQIYRELGKLDAEGMAEAETVDLPNRPPKKTYTLTEAGRHALDEWLSRAPFPVPKKDDLLVRLYCLDRMPNDAVVRLLEEGRDHYESEARDTRGRLAHVSRTDPAQLGLLLTLEATLSFAEAHAQWCMKALASVQAVGDAEQGPEEPELRKAAG